MNFRRLFFDAYGLRVGVVFGSFALVFVVIVVLVIRSETAFARFVEENQCKAIAQDPGFFMTTLMPMSCGTNCTTVMPITTWVEGAKTWRCKNMADFKR